MVFCYVFDLLISFNPTLIQTTSSGKIIAKPSSILREMEELHEESGLVCCICREGYKYHPQKVCLLLRFWRNVLSLVVKSFTRHSSVFCIFLSTQSRKTIDDFLFCQKNLCCSDFIGAALNCLSPVWYFITFHSISTNGSFKYNGHRIDFSEVNDLVFASSFE